MIVYAVHDSNDGRLYQFASPDTTLAKDAVLAFVEENRSTLFGLDSHSQSLCDNFMAQISSTSSVEELISVVNSLDMAINLIKIS